MDDAPELDMVGVERFLEKISNHEFYHYEGSLTTPECNEIVDWYVIATPQYISWTNWNSLYDHMGVSNRNVQDLNGRKVMKGFSSALSYLLCVFFVIVNLGA